MRTQKKETDDFAFKIPALESLPNGWAIRKLKFVADVRLSNVDKKTLEGQTPVRLCNYVDVYKNNTINSSIEFMEATATTSQTKTFELHKDDVLITKDSEDWRDIAVPAYVEEDLPGVLCGYHLAHIRPHAEIIDGNYLARCFSAEGLADQFRVSANGITRYGIGKDSIADALIPLPPLQLQKKIALFIDRKTALIDILIAKKERQIELLKEKRQILISHAVTKGLNKNTPMKNSGVPHLGKIPAHWDLIRLKFKLKKIEQGWSPQCESRQAEPDEWGVLKVGCVNSLWFDEAENKALPNGIIPIKEYEVKCGDILVSRANTAELLGSASLVRKIRTRLLLCDKLYRLIPKANGLSTGFLMWSLRSSTTRFVFEREATGASSSMKNIGQDTIRNLLIPLPPPEEQDCIAIAVKSYVENIEIQVQTILQQLQKLSEYRATLISSAITGKISINQD